MSKTNILIIVIVIVAIGVGIYFALTYQKPYLPAGEEEQVSETEAPEGIPAEEGLPAAPTAETKEFQGMKYEIVNFGFSTDEIHRVVYDIITGELTEEQAKTLAEKIIGDTITEDSSIEEITLLFYSDKSSAVTGKYDVAHVIWLPNETRVEMIEK